jgi:hypothetical protein
MKYYNHADTERYKDNPFMKDIKLKGRQSVFAEWKYTSKVE